MDFVGYLLQPLTLGEVEGNFAKTSMKMHLSGKKGVVSKQFHTRHSVYDGRDFNLAIGLGSWDSSRVMLSVGAVEAKRLIGICRLRILPQPRYEAGQALMTRCGQEHEGRVSPDIGYCGH